MLKIVLGFEYLFALLFLTFWSGFTLFYRAFGSNTKIKIKCLEFNMCWSHIALKNKNNKYETFWHIISLAIIRTSYIFNPK